MRRTLPLVITFVIGLFMLAEYFIPHYRYHIVTAEFVEWGVILSAAAFLLGIINLVRVNLPRILRREKDWPYKLLMLGSLFVTLVVGYFAGDPNGDASAPTDDASSATQAYYQFELASREVSGWIYDYLFQPLNSTMFALLAFFIASAAFRAFRARNLDATILLGAAILVMVARVPLGEGIPFFGEYLPGVMNWIMDVPNVAARRAIFIGAALGAIATGLRVILGIERSHLGGDE